MCHRLVPEPFAYHYSTKEVMVHEISQYHEKFGKLLQRTHYNILINGGFALFTRAWCSLVYRKE